MTAELIVLHHIDPGAVGSEKNAPVTVLGDSQYLPVQKTVVGRIGFDYLPILYEKCAVSCSGNDRPVGKLECIPKAVARKSGGAVSEFRNDILPVAYHKTAIPVG